MQINTNLNYFFQALLDNRNDNYSYLKNGTNVMTQKQGMITIYSQNTNVLDAIVTLSLNLLYS